jgi:ParB family chromosome partitioning protein
MSNILLAMELKELPIDKIKPNPLQPREYFDREKIRELADSVKEVGLLNPIQVRPKGKEYEIIAGERRWKACQVAGKKTVPSIIKKVDDAQLMIESLIENVHREDLSDIEKAKALKIIMQKGKITSIVDLAKRVGLSKSYIDMIFDVADIRKELPEQVKEVSLSVISETRPLPKEERKKIIEIAAEKELGGRKVRKLISVIKKAPPSLKKQILEKKLEPEAAERKLEVKVREKEPKAAAEIVAKEVTCPICKIKLKLIHRYPRGHRVEEV